MLESPSLDLILRRIRPDAPAAEYRVESGVLVNWNQVLLGFPPSQQEVDRWEPLLQQESQARTTRRAALRALREGSGNLTAAQITAVLRMLAREVLGDD